ncbi:hypothetical protein [Gorillibacterium sp. sgz5001074]|uniref:hypothetical protein n=1 Tax=Gorillibacterium sp. sgz5001074 TaxID=3446695 RepID=UPI003F6671DF
MSPATIEQERNEQLDIIVRRMYRDMSINLNNCQAASDWVQMTLAEVAREKKNALPARRTPSLRSRLKNLLVLIVAQGGN